MGMTAGKVLELKAPAWELSTNPGSAELGLCVWQDAETKRKPSLLLAGWILLRRQESFHIQHLQECCLV